MEIIRVEDGVEKSRIDGNEVAKLPDGLKVMMVALLAKIPGVKRINVSNKAGGALFELADKNVDLSYFPDVKKEFIKTIELLLWYNQPHWYSAHLRAIGSPVFCAHCGYQSVPGAVHGTECPTSYCPSRKKWRLIIGPSYKPPKQSSYNIPRVKLPPGSKKIIKRQIFSPKKK